MDCPGAVLPRPPSPSRPDDPGGGARRAWPAYALAAGVGVLGLVMMHHPMILSGLRRVQVDLGDSRLNHYFLEHNYLWYLGAPGHASFWDPPFFYPARNIAAYSDTMLGIAPVYAAFRAVGFAPDTSFQLWTIAVSALNYLAMLHFLGRRLGASVPAAAGGAALFAFGSPRLNVLETPQQLPQFLSLIAADALFGLFADGAGPWYRRAALWLVAAAGLGAQLTSGYYLGWFMTLSLGLVAALALRMPSSRGPLLATLRRDAPWVAAAAVLGGLAMRPWLAHHLAAARELGPRYLSFVLMSMPRPGDWFDTGPRNWLAGWLAGLAGASGPAGGQREALGIGLTTTAVALAGLWRARHRTSTRLLATAAVLLVLCVTHLPPWLVAAAKPLLVVGAVALAYAGREERPRAFLLIVAMVLLTLVLKGLVVESLVGSGAATTAIAVAALLGRGGGRRVKLAQGALVLGLSLTLIPAVTLGVAAVCGALLAVATAPLGGWSPRRAGGVTLGGGLLIGGLITYATWPTVLLIALAAPLACAAARRARPRPPARFLPDLAFAGLAAEAMVQAGMGWVFFYIHVPGAASMIFVFRAGLMLLIPAAVGLASAADSPWARRRPALAACVGLVCLLEQGATTPSFDKQANREAIASLARRIDGHSEAFYYTPPDGPAWPPRANLDAMWAGIERGRPTLNGYSGHTPRGWRELDVPPDPGPDELAKLGRALARWRDGPGRSVGSVQWIGGPDDRPRRRAGDGPPEAHTPTP